MSTVFRAFDTTLERRVAVKLMHREIASDSDQLERFRREARSVAQLSHPHIVGVIDAGEEDGRPYIVLEYVEGETLKDRIRRMGRLPIDEAIAYAIEIARALGAAHAGAIVHRDIKPQNVLVDEEGSAKVTDFGIARSLEEEGLTADGRVLGTTDYVSPEQALGHDVDGQSDIYSLGVVLYEMLTGDVPFHGENQVSVAMKHVREDLPDVQLERPEVSARLAAVLDRMTDKDLAHRHPDAATLEADLEDALAAEASRTGTSTGEATAVLRTLPAEARRRLPLRLRLRLPVLLLILMIGVGRRHRLPAVRPGRGARPARDRAGPDQGAPGRGDRLGQEHVGERLRPARRRQGGAPRRGAARGRPGLRHRLDHRALRRQHAQQADRRAGRRALHRRRAARSTPARSRSRRRSRAGRWRSTARRTRPTDEWPSDDWTKLAAGTVEKRKQTFKLDTGDRRYRYYLVWITALPPDSDQVAITQLTLSARPESLRSGGGARSGGAPARAGAAGRTPRARGRPSPPTASGTPTSASCPAAC